MTDPQAKKQKAVDLDMFMLFEPHVLYAKRIGIRDERIRRALLQQLQTKNSQFTNRRDLLNAILDQPKD